MPQDAYTIKYIAKQLNKVFVGGKISKINQPERDELSLIVYTKNGSLKLEISASPKFCRVSLGGCEKPNPQVAPNFCMLLRKHLQNAEILDIAQVGRERIIYFDFKCFSEFEITEMRLYCEIMGKYSNLILTQNGVICGALKTASIEDNAHRILLNGAKYTLPSPQDKVDPIDLFAMQKLFESCEGDKAKFISNNVLGIAYTTAADMVESLGEGATAEEVYNYINDEKTSPCIVYDNGTPIDFKVKSAYPDKVDYPDILAAQQAFYDDAYTQKTFTDKKNKLEHALQTSIKKWQKRLTQIEQKLAECEEAEDIKLKGELITANIYAIQRGMSSFEAINYYDENCGKINIQLDKQLTPSQNAQKYYKKYAKLKRTITNLSEQRKEVTSQMEYLNSIECNICAAERLDDLTETQLELVEIGLIKSDENSGKKKNKVIECPFRTYNIEGFKVIAGRNNVQNDRLLKSISSGDIWLHTQKYHSSHVAIITQGNTVPDSVIKCAAEICAYYSQAAGTSKAPVDYTLKKFVKKPPKANLGFVIYTDYKTILVAPDAHTELIKNG